MDTNKLLASIMGGSLPNRGVELKIHRQDYPFLMCNLFGKTIRDDEILKDFIFSLVFEYLEKWRLLDAKNDSKKNRYGLFNFQSSIDFKKIAGEIYNSSEKHSTLLMPASNAVLELKRFGDALGLKLKGNNSNPDDEHVSGTKILEALCNDERGHGINFGEFVHSIECVIPLPKNHKENNSVIVDFSQVCDELMVACPYISWNLQEAFVRDLMGISYKNTSNGCGFAERSLMGNSEKCNLLITAQLVHYGASEAQKSPQWRRGNVEKLDNGVYQFADGKDLCLSIQVECPFPKLTFLLSIPEEKEVSRIQNDLRLTGASIYVQLCARMVDKYY